MLPLVGIQDTIKSTYSLTESLVQHRQDPEQTAIEFSLLDTHHCLSSEPAFTFPVPVEMT